MRKTAVSVVALPVSWVGKIFYTEDARVETIRIWPVYFEAGTTTFAKDFDRHAERLAGFLRGAPGVSLDMESVLTVAAGPSPPWAAARSGSGRSARSCWEAL